ncbi:MAG: nucleotidyltransferase family protein [Muribaculaceae bacterium]
MDKEQAIKLAQRYKAALAEQLPIKAIYLYGSYSKGTNTATSDIDIAVILDKLNDDYFADTPKLWKIRRNISNLIEPVLLSEDSNCPLFSDVIKTGILI